MSNQKVNIVLDASQLDTFQLCPEKYKNRYILNKSTPFKAKPLDRGTLVHAGLESYYAQIKEYQVSNNPNKKYEFDNYVMNALLTVKQMGVVSDLEVSEVGRVVEVLDEYFEFWRVADQNLEIIIVENPFTYLLHEDETIRIYMSGKIDLLVNDRHYKNLPVDHKSYDRSYESRRLTNQFMNYANAVNSNFLLVNKIGFQKSLKDEQKFKRVPLSYDPLILKQWKDNVVKIVYSYLHCVAENSWSMNLTSCDKFNRLCEYYDVCDSSGEEAKIYKLNANFIDIEPWDVTKVLSKTNLPVDHNDLVKNQEINQEVKNQEVKSE